MPFLKRLLPGVILLVYIQTGFAQTATVPVDSLFRTETPASSYNDSRYELGSEFQTLSDGFITRARLFTHINEGGDHTVRLWVLNGSTYSLAAGPFVWNFTSGIQGWRSYTFSSPVAVQANKTYTISITNGPDFNYERTYNFTSSAPGTYVRYIRGVYNTTIGQVPSSTYNNSCYFRDVVFATSGTSGGLTAGTIGTAQTICYNTTPAPLTQITAPTGGDGTYTYQWQSSPDNSAWTNINGATSSGYAPPALSATTYYRRTVSSGTATPVNCTSVQITVSTQITLAQLHDNITINNNTSTNINVAITGGTGPFTINYSRNGTAQSAITNYSSGTNISTGILTTGVYTYALTSVTSANGCIAQNLGTSITVTVNSSSGSSYVPLDSLYRAETPADSYNDSRYELGSEFQTLSDGFITRARLFTHINEGGDHTVRLWVLNGSTYTLAAGPFVWNFTSGIHGWRAYTFSSPVAVQANKTYTISITNGPDFNYERSYNFTSSAPGTYVRYIRGVYNTTIGQVPSSTFNNSCYFRDVVFATSGTAGGLTAGTIGTAQTICYNATPAPLTQITAPTGGDGTYTYQWQSSPDNSAWTNINGATSSGYAPPALSATTYYRRTVSSGTATPVNCTSVQITVSTQITLAQLHDNITINNNTSTNINVAITGGTGPFTINYARNGTAQSAITNYSSGTNISTGVLTTGVYTYALTSVTSANGCIAQNLGTSITVTVNSSSGSSYVPLDSLYRAETPADSYNDNPYELGSEFQVLSDGFITRARLFTHINEGGQHTIRLWVLNGSTYSLAAGPFVWNFSSGIQGWRSYTFSSPVAVQANKTYTISITNGPDYNYERTYNFTSSAPGTYVRYIRGVYNMTLGQVPSSTFNNSCYFRDVVFATSGTAGGLTAGTIGTAQTICYNTTPAPLTQITAPTGGDGTYTYQWQSSPNNSAWTNINGATSSGYAPPALSVTTYYRRTVSSGTATPVNCTSVQITVSTQITLAQLHDNITINNSTSTNINVAITGGTGPFTINYSRNGTAQSAITNYSSGNNISTGILTTGVYTYALTSVTSANGCIAQNLGTSITVTVNSTSGSSYVPLDSLYRAETPADSYNDNPYELGSEFQVLSDGFITRARLFTHINEGGQHTIRLWVLNGSTYTLAAGPFVWNFTSGIQGWRAYTFSSPVAVQANKTYTLSITNGPDYNYERTYNFTSSAPGTYVRYIRGVYNMTLGQVPTSTYLGSCYFRDVVFATSGTAGELTAGTIGTAQTICTNTAPVPLTQITAPSGGDGTYTFQWQSSPDNSTWTNINGATSSGYAPPALSVTTYFRRTVSSGSANSVNCAPVQITVSSDQCNSINSNKALVIVNSASADFSDFGEYIAPYLNNFGIPYDVTDISTTGLPDFLNYAVIIFGHKNVYTTGYPIAQLEASLSSGVGLYSFDPHLFDFSSGFNTPCNQTSVHSNQINISNTTHYITQNHTPDTYNPTNNVVNALNGMTVVQNSILVNGTDLVTMTSGGSTVTLMQVSDFGSGKIVKWCSYDWASEDILGPMYGMDDLIWRGIVWVARKPFVMQGLPPMITMRVDDVDGQGGGVINNFEWIHICNEFGIIPWCGTFNSWIPAGYIPTLKILLDNNLATASPHAFDYRFIYYNHDALPDFDPAANVRLARDFYIQNGLKMSKYLVPHWYEISSTAIPEVHAMGIEYIAIHMLPDNNYHYSTPWLNCGPYRINGTGPASNEYYPVYYAGNVHLNGFDFFNCLTEIRDDGTYEWYPTGDSVTTIARGIRHLRRSFNSMALASLFTHEHFFADINTANWREIIRRITTSVAGFNPEYRSTDYAVQYIRAKSNIRITNVQETLTNVDISYSGNNDLDTKCYLFTEQNGIISFRFVGLPQVTGINSVSVIK